MEQDGEKTELGLLPRLIAAGWFAAAALVPVAFFFIVLGGGNSIAPIESKVLFFFVEIPAGLAGLFGFSIGIRILDPVSRMSLSRAAFLGVSVALLSYVVFLALYVLQMQIAHPSMNLGFVVLAVLIGSGLLMWPVVGAGALAGLLLCRWSCQPYAWEWLLNMPRVTPRRANLWINVAALIVLLNCAAVLKLFIHE